MMMDSTPASTTYKIDPKEVQRLENVFTYHAPKGDQANRYTKLREEAKALAFSISELVPPGRERALALTHIETAIMFANAGIARGE